MTESDEDEYCAECGDPEFDEDGEKTHASDDYDHDFEPKEEDEEEDEGLTLDDVKKGADTLTSIAKAAKAFKDLSDDSKSKIETHSTSTPRPPHYDPNLPIYAQRVAWWQHGILKPKKQSRSEVEKKLDVIEEKIDHGKKQERKRWIIGLAIGGVIAILIAILV